MTKRFVLGFSIIIMVLEAVFIAYTHYIEYIDLQVMTSNALVSDKAVTLLFREASVPPLKALTDDYPEATFMYKVNLYNGVTMCGLSGNCDMGSRVDSMIQGRFFEKKDFFNKAFKAVVGKNVLNSAYCFKDQKGNPYFEFNQNKYEIIGQISSDVNSMLDNTVFINLDSINHLQLHSLTIDGEDSDRVAKDIEQIKGKYDVDVDQEDKNFIKRYLINGTDQQSLEPLIIVFMSLLLMMAIVFTVYDHSEEMKVKRIIGVGFKKIFLELFGNICGLTAAGTITLGIVYAAVYGLVLKKFYLDFHGLLLAEISAVTVLSMGLAVYVYIRVSDAIFYKNGVK